MLRRSTGSIFADGAVLMISNSTYKSVEEASKLGVTNLRVYARLIAHRIDVVLCSARSAASAADFADSEGSRTLAPPTVLASGYRAWFTNR
jgi:hypothetical protein